MISSYTKILAFGHKYLDWQPEDIVVVQEKIDGSQFSMMYQNGEFYCRSNNVQINLLDPGMFSKAVQTAQKLDLMNGWVYRGEFLQKPKHNTLAYERVPKDHIIMFDIDAGIQDYLGHQYVEQEAERIGLECVPTYWRGRLAELPPLDNFLKNTSILGGAIEGVVIKNYSRIGKDGKVSMAKYVSDKFKEVHGKDWKERNPSRTDFMDSLAEEYKTEARWAKAVQHLEESGQLVNAMNDIPLLMKEVSTDILAECKEEIADKLFAYFWKKYSRKFTHGLPEWYKEQLIAEREEE